MQRISNPRTLVLLIVLVIGLSVVSNLLRGPAGEAEEPDVAEEITPQVVFAVGPLEVTSTVINTWAMMLLLGVAAYLIGRNLKLRPGMVQNMLEWIVEAIEKLIREMVGVEDATMFLPHAGFLHRYRESDWLAPRAQISHAGHQHAAGYGPGRLFQRALFRDSYARSVGLP